MKTIRPNKKSRNYYKAMSEKNRSMLLSYKDARELEYAYDEIDHALNKVMVKIWRNTGRVYELWAHTARFPRFREEENKEETEIFVKVGSSNTTIQSYGKCRQHKNFGKIIKTVNDMRTQNQ